MLVAWTRKSRGYLSLDDCVLHAYLIAGETMGGIGPAHLVFDDKTPTPRLVSCQPPEVVTRPLSSSHNFA